MSNGPWKVLSHTVDCIPYVFPGQRHFYYVSCDDETESPIFQTEAEARALADEWNERDKE